MAERRQTCYNIRYQPARGAMMKIPVMLMYGWILVLLLMAV